MNFTSKIKMFLCVFPVLPENKAKPTCLSPYRGGYHPPDPGLITNQVRWMVKCSATAKSFPRGGASRSESVQCTVSPGISKFIAASHRPLPPRRAGAPSPKGRSWRQPFVDTIHPGLYRTALRERENDILPYGGWEILTGTIQPGAPKCTCHRRKDVTGRVREVAGLVKILRASLKNRAG